MADSSLSENIAVHNTGIYKITNTVNGKCYVGSAVNLKKRMKEHRKVLCEAKHHSRHLQCAWIKYGGDIFDFQVILYCDKENLIFYEQRAIDAYKSANNGKGYNVTPTAGSQLGFRHTKESLEKLSHSRKGKYAGKANHNFGKPQRESVRKKISATLMGRFRGEESPFYGRKASEETCKKISAAGKGRPPWNKGLTADADPRVKKYVDAQIGKIISEEQREQIRVKLTGFKHSEDARHNMSMAQKTKAWASEERREKARLRLTGKPSRMQGKNHSEETRSKMSESHKRRGKVL